MQRPFKRISVLLSILIGVGLILGYVENLIFPQGFALGIKLGISNIVVVFILLFAGTREAIAVAVIKSVLSGLLFSSLTAAIYSLAGCLLSVCVMYALKKMYYPAKISEIGISIAGSAAFNIGQVLIACVITRSTASVYLLSYMLPLSIVTGTVTGMISYFVLERFKKRDIF